MAQKTGLLARFNGLIFGDAAAPEGTADFRRLSEVPDAALIPPLDRPRIDSSKLTQDQRDWRREGVVIKRGFIPEEITAPYIERRLKLRNVSENAHMGGWATPTPYEHVPELRALSLYPPLMGLMRELLSEPMMLHLNLTGFVSTERNWHQDDYLNPDFVNSWYAAVWIALGDIHERAGPFQYIPGSHQWPLLRQNLVKSFMKPEERDARSAEGYEVWPKTSESFVVPAIEAEIAARAVPARQFLAQRGDVLIWHGRLMHRGSKAIGPDFWRPAVIAHYSGVNHRPDMKNRAQDENGQWYAVFGHPLRPQG